MEEGVYIITGIAIILMFLLGLGYLQFHYKETQLKYNSGTQLNIDSFSKTLDTVNSKCGSTFITKKYDDDNYYIFIVPDKYKLLEDCLN